jgi:hypothetical protein
MANCTDPCLCVTQSMCYSDPEFKCALLKILCNLNALIAGGLPPNVPTQEAVFGEQAVVAAGAIGASYAVASDLPDNTRSFSIDNQTDGDVQVSMDGGTTDHYLLESGDSVNIPLAHLGLVTTAEISLKRGTDVPTAGSVYIYSVS